MCSSLKMKTLNGLLLFFDGKKVTNEEEGGIAIQVECWHTSQIFVGSDCQYSSESHRLLTSKLHGGGKREGKGKKGKTRKWEGLKPFHCFSLTSTEFYQKSLILDFLEYLFQKNVEKNRFGYSNYQRQDNFRTLMSCSRYVSNGSSHEAVMRSVTFRSITHYGEARKSNENVFLLHVRTRLFENLSKN